MVLFFLLFSFVNLGVFLVLLGFYRVRGSFVFYGFSYVLVFFVNSKDSRVVDFFGGGIRVLGVGEICKG